MGRITGHARYNKSQLHSSPFWVTRSSHLTSSTKHALRLPPLHEATQPLLHTMRSSTRSSPSLVDLLLLLLCACGPTISLPRLYILLEQSHTASHPATPPKALHGFFDARGLRLRVGVDVANITVHQRLGRRQDVGDQHVEQIDAHTLADDDAEDLDAVNRRGEVVV